MAPSVFGGPDGKAAQPILPKQVLGKVFSGPSHEIVRRTDQVPIGIRQREVVIS